VLKMLFSESLIQTFSKVGWFLLLNPKKLEK
jgi:hypothetical protein